MYDRQRLIELIRDRALQIGEFTLASGQKASFYLDCRKLTLDGEGANVVAQGILDHLESDWPDAVGGMAIGADPITAAVITLAWQRGRMLSGFIVRKEAKQHGTGREIEGPVKPGNRVVVVEDTATTGQSSLQAAEKARRFGMEVRGVVAIVDRLQGAAETLAHAGLPFHSLLTVEDLGIRPAAR